MTVAGIWRGCRRSEHKRVKIFSDTPHEMSDKIFIIQRFRPRKPNTSSGEQHVR